MKKETVKEYIGKAEVKHLKNRFNDFLNGECGFMFIGTIGDKESKITDCYKGICKNCVLEAVNIALNEAEKLGLLAKYKVDKKYESKTVKGASSAGSATARSTSPTA